MRLPGRRPAAVIAAMSIVALVVAALLVAAVSRRSSDSAADGPTLAAPSPTADPAVSPAPRGSGSLGSKPQVSSAQPTPGAESAPQRTDRAAGGFAAGGAEPWNSRRATNYAAMRAAGLTWMRTDFDWRQLESVRGRWDLPLYAPVVADAAGAGLRTLAVLHTVPAWANGGAGDHAPPADPARLTDFCYRTVRHYLPLGVTTYEIGNEVNLPASGRPEPDGTAYTKKFLRPCVAGVRRAAAEAKVRATVLLGSLVPTDDGDNAPEKFLADVYAAGGAGSFDATALHPYTGKDAPTRSDKLTRVPDRMYRVMKANGDGRSLIWATEFGYPTAGGDSVSEADQRRFVAPALKAWYRHSFTGPLFWYCPRDTGQDRSEREDHFGLMRFDGSRKPAYDAVAAWYNR
jgi:polysaccharide biosynthesis protein PslG